jgi:hypothetical protein
MVGEAQLRFFPHSMPERWAHPPGSALRVPVWVVDVFIQQSTHPPSPRVADHITLGSFLKLCQ